MGTTVNFDVTGQADRVDGRASAQWATRPMDQRFVSMDDLIASLQARTERSENRILRLADITPVADDGEMRFDAAGLLTAPTNFSFSQYCKRIGVPGGFLANTLGDDPRLAAQVLRHGSAKADSLQSEVGVLHGMGENGLELRAVTGKDYGRIWDVEVAKAIQKVVESGGGRWEVPTAFRTADGKGAFGTQYDCVDPTKEETTLYASDRDQFGFLVDQRNPIEAGKLANGDPDLYFRGFYWWNGECGDISNGVNTFLYRYVCMNRNIWGQKEFQGIRIIHSKNAAQRFVTDLVPALEQFVNGSATGVVTGLEAARRAKIARNDEDRIKFFDRFGFGPKETAAICGKCIDEEGRPVESIFDAMQALTAWARMFGNQDRRVEVERVGSKMMQLVAA